MPTKKLKMPKVEELDMAEDKIIVPKVVENEIAEAIEVSVIIAPLGTNHRQVRIAFDVHTNKVTASDIPDIVQTVLKKAAPMIGDKLVEIIGVEKNLLNATTQE